MLGYAIKTVNILSQYWMHICMFSPRASFTDYFQFSWKAWFARWYLDNCIDCDCEVKVEVNAGWGFGQCQLLSAVCHFLWNLGQTTPGNKQQETSHAFVSVSKLFLFFSSGWLPSEMQRVHSENSSQSLASGKIISCKWEDPEKKWIVDRLEQT